MSMHAGKALSRLGRCLGLCAFPWVYALLFVLACCGSDLPHHVIPLHMIGYLKKAFNPLALRTAKILTFEILTKR